MTGNQELGTRNQELARAVWFAAPRTVELRDEPARAPGPGELLVTATASAISHGTEMLVYRGQVPEELGLDLPTLVGGFSFPIKYGYAAVGRVLEVGPGVSDFQPGDDVFALHPHQSRFVVPTSLAWRLPPGIGPERGMFVANLETALNALLDEPVRVGEHVVVFGQGVVGTLIGVLARRAGAGRVVVVDRHERRRALARRLGADEALAPGPDLRSSLDQLTEGRGADLVFEASGDPTALQSAVEAVAVGGTVVVCSWYGAKSVGLQLGGHFHRGRVRIRSSQVGQLDPGLLPRWDRARRGQAVLSLLEHLPLDQLVTHRIPFEEAARAYRLVDEHPEDTIQVILTYP
jgi:2-desacetyl-2-hydroxyethyl bacteriochlorophyllide A dehydrogenase